MAATNSDKEETGVGNTAVTDASLRDHDRVQMLSLRVDGTPDQHEPELVGDPEGTLAATREQFRQQAVSVRDSELRRPIVAVAEDTEEDPTVAELKEAHQEAEQAAESAADKAVAALHPGVESVDDGVVETAEQPEVKSTNKPGGASPTDSDAGLPGSSGEGSPDDNA